MRAAATRYEDLVSLDPGQRNHAGNSGRIFHIRKRGFPFRIYGLLPVQLPLPAKYWSVAVHKGTLINYRTVWNVEQILESLLKKRLLSKRIWRIILVLGTEVWFFQKPSLLFSKLVGNFCTVSFIHYHSFNGLFLSAEKPPPPIFHSMSLSHLAFFCVLSFFLIDG